MHRFSMNRKKGCIRKHITVQNVGEDEAQIEKDVDFHTYAVKRSHRLLGSNQDS